MLSTIESINSAVNNFIWGVPAMICIIGVGLYLTLRTHFLQIRKFPYAIKTTIGRMFWGLGECDCAGRNRRWQPHCQYGTVDSQSRFGCPVRQLWPEYDKRSALGFFADSTGRNGRREHERELRQLGGNKGCTCYHR